MPRKKKTIIEESLPDNAITTEDGETIMFGDDTPLDEMFDSFGEEPFLMKVYRITPTGSSFVFSSTEKPNPALFESLIQERCPTGGKFVVRFYKNNRIVEPSRHVEIEPVVVKSNSTNSTDTVVINMLQQQLSTFQNMVMAFIGRPAPITQQTPMNELVVMMQALHGIKPESKDPVDLLTRGMELGAKMNGSASPDWKAELIHTAKDVLAPVAQIVAQHKMSEVMPQQNQIAERSSVNMGVTNSLIKAGLSSLKPKILSGMLEPALAVDWILANASDTMYQPFLAMALQGDINTFIQIDPDFANEPYRNWVISTITMLKEAYGNNNNQANNDGGIGNGTNTTSNEINSTRLTEISKVV